MTALNADDVKQVLNIVLLKSTKIGRTITKFAPEKKHIETKKKRLFGTDSWSFNEFFYV